jgi:CheY-like chemotaxis protein
MVKKILVVEDVADIQLMMRVLLESFGYQVITANDGSEAVEKVKEDQPDLILMDIMMPVLDGISATKIIREFETDKIPIIAVTAYDNPYHQRALDAGCNEVIPKPLDFEYLKTRLTQYLV